MNDYKTKIWQIVSLWIVTTDIQCYIQFYFCTYFHQFLVMKNCSKQIFFFLWKLHSAHWCLLLWHFCKHSSLKVHNVKLVIYYENLHYTYMLDEAYWTNFLSKIEWKFLIGNLHIREEWHNCYLYHLINCLVQK